MEETPPSSPSNHSGEVKSRELQPVKSFGKEQEKMEDFSIFDMLKQPSTKISSELSQTFVKQSEHTFHRVHGYLRNINEKAYEPEVIAIGPYHRDKNNLKMMEAHKWRYLSLICKGKKENFDRYCSAIEPLEQAARNCYADSISLNKDEFVRMLVLDGCFIIEFVSQVMRGGWNDPITRMDWILNSVQRDLMLFENQIPFFVLCRLFELINGEGQANHLLSLLSSFFHSFIPPTWFSNGSPHEDRESSIGLLIRFFRSICHVKEDSESSNRRTDEDIESSNRCIDEDIESSNRCPEEIEHLLHLIRINLVSSFESDLANRVKYKRKQLRDIKSATWLTEANVKFKRNKGASSLFDIRFERGTLFLPTLTVDDGTESLFRNLIAFEQYLHDTESTWITNRYKCVTDYMLFLDCLINSAGDVEILSHFDIIKNYLGNDEVPAEIFNNLTVISDEDFIYGEIFDKVEEHCIKCWNRWMANLRRNYLNRWMANLRTYYFNSRLAIIPFIAAIVLLLLTVAQTIFSALSLW